MLNPGPDLVILLGEEIFQLRISARLQRSLVSFKEIFEQDIKLFHTPAA